MKKHNAVFFAGLSTIFIIGTVQANDLSLSDFLANEKTRHEAKNWIFDQAKQTALFNTMDTDKDGVVTGAERKTYWDGVTAAKKAKANGFDLAKFTQIEKVKYAKNGKKFNAEQTATLFNTIDTNNDGVITGVERKTYWDNQK